jgi:epoxyqueuosine reductase
MYVCGGLTGLHVSGKWSTWSLGRFTIKESFYDSEPAFQRVLGPYSRWPKIEGGIIINSRSLQTDAFA